MSAAKCDKFVDDDQNEENGSYDGKTQNTIHDFVLHVCSFSYFKIRIPI